MSRVAVIGAGVFGAWSAWSLTEAGHVVTLLDAYGPANGRASSADHSRVIRAGYGADDLYSRWATESVRDWQWLSSKVSQQLVTTTGALFLGEPGNSHIRATFETLSRLSIRAEWLEPPVIASRFPQISTAGLGPALFEPDASVVRARSAVQALVRLSIVAGVEYRVARVAPLDESSNVLNVRLSDGSSIDADYYVMACGAWLPKVFPQTIGDRIRPTRQEVLYFGVSAADESFSSPRMPVWIDFAAGVYGVPDIDAWGFKIGIDRHGTPIDPDSADRLVDHDLVERTRQWMAHRFPGLVGEPLLDARVCQYENSSSGDLIIDRHPAWPNVLIVGGGSGHGFKHGPRVGRYVADLIADRVTPEPRFALASKSVDAQRSVF